MMDSYIKRHLKTADLYDRVVATVRDSDDNTLDETRLRGLLDAIYNAGKVDVALALGTAPEARMIEGWQAIVDSVR